MAGARKIIDQKNGRSLFPRIQSNLGILFSMEERLNVLLHPINDSENHTSEFCLGECLSLLQLLHSLFGVQFLHSRKRISDYLQSALYKLILILNKCLKYEMHIKPPKIFKLATVTCKKEYLEIVFRF